MGIWQNRKTHSFKKKVFKKDVVLKQTAQHLENSVRRS